MNGTYIRIYFAPINEGDKFFGNIIGIFGSFARPAIATKARL